MEPQRFRVAGDAPLDGVAVVPLALRERAGRNTAAEGEILVSGVQRGDGGPGLPQCRFEQPPAHDVARGKC